MKILLQPPRRRASAGAFASLLVAGALVLAPRTAHAQTRTGTIIVHVTANSVPISGATIAAGATNSVTDESGVAKLTLPTGPRTFHVTPVGLRPESLAVFVGVGTANVSIALHPKSIPTSAPAAVARGGNRAASVPASSATSSMSTGVEVLDREAIEEQLDGSPGTIAELLTRSGGVRVQPLSAGSGGAGIRIRGMPARYTKILSDGLPLYGATPEGLEPLQISALGIERVEIIKGVASPLYGPTALGGAVNLVSATPDAPSEAVVNGAAPLGSDVALWQTHTFTPRWAATLLAGRHYQSSDDPDGDGWAELAGYRRVVVRPRVYWSRSATSSWFMTGGWTTENRFSGTFGDARLPDFHTYSDDADTRRADAGTVGRVVLDSTTLLTIRGSMTKEWLTRVYGSDRESDRRTTIFSEVAVTKTLGTNVLVGGAALERDQYSALDVRGQSYRFTTPALFAEHTWTPDTWYSVTSSARLDLQSEYGDFVSPRMSVYVHPSENWNARLSAAAGVYAPTPLSDETEGFGLSHLRSTAREAEHAAGWSLDVGHVDGALELRGSAYRTTVRHPLILRTAPGSSETLELVNADEAARTQGIDLIARYRMRPLRFTATYSYIDATRPQIGEIVGEDFRADTTMLRVAPFNPRHSVNLDLAHERENDRLLGVEVHFAGRQALTDTLITVGQAYVTLDARFEKHVGRGIVFVHGKNLSGVHQSQFTPLLRRASGAAGQWTYDVWAPLEGRVINAGLRVKY